MNNTKLPIHEGEDWTGRVVNGIEVIGLDTPFMYLDSGKKRQITWALKCHCGNLTSAPKAQVVKGNQMSCHKCRRSTRPYLTISDEGWEGKVPRTYLGSINRGAIKRNLQMKVSLLYLSQLLQAQEFRCALSGKQISFMGSNSVYWTASLDRIDSSVGYVVGNVQWVHRDINLMKSNLPQDLFLQLCSQVHLHNKVV